MNTPDQNRTDRLYVLVRPDEKTTIIEAAKRAERSISDFVRLAALEKANGPRDV